MSAVPYRGFLSSKPFLVFGPKRTLFYAHGNLLAQCSPVLNKDVNGGMREKQLETIEIEDVDGDIDDDTVMRFIEYAYSGDYTVPNPVVLQLPTDSKELQEAFVGNLELAENEDGWGTPGKKSKKIRKSKAPAWPGDIPPPEEILASPPCPTEPLEGEALRMKKVPGPIFQPVDSTREKRWVRFCSLATASRRAAWQPVGDNDERDDYAVVFLCHARLYKFSDRYGCKGLMNLALQKLRLTLSRYIFHKERAASVVELIQYTNAHTLDLDQGHDRLRALVLEYASCYFRELMQEPSFIQLLQEGGPLPSDLMAKIAEMVS